MPRPNRSERRDRRDDKSGNWARLASGSEAPDFE
jgi:hypothetical protein